MVKAGYETSVNGIPEQQLKKLATDVANRVEPRVNSRPYA